MKPENITQTDWELLNLKYSESMDQIKRKLSENYPVQYLIGNVDFYDCLIEINENVLIPRFETELLVDKALKKLQTMNLKTPNIIDLGCGSGCISIAIKKNLDCLMTSIDINKDAIQLAKLNANKNEVEITFKNQSIEETCLDNFDVIISNPPYVREDEVVGLEIKYEPQNAIFAKEEGTYFYRIILEKIYNSIKKPKLIAFEIGMEQQAFFEGLCPEILPEYKLSIEKDYQGRTRFVFLEKGDD